MRYHIDTIPVWDSLKLDGECLLCALHRKLELGEVDRYLGASVMEPDTRIQVNAKGFCPHHHAMLFAVGNRLGHALMLFSHADETRDKLAKAFEEVNTAAAAYSEASLLTRMTSKGQAARKSIADCADMMDKLTGSCVLCDSINENMNRYLHTFFHLYRTDKEFHQRFVSGKGVCLTHAAQLIRLAPEELPGKEVAGFIKALTESTLNNMDRVQGDLDWFIKKFDYRFGNEPWKNSRDAVERSVNKLRGWCVGAEPNPEEK